MKSKIRDTGILQSSFEGAADTLKRLTLIGEDVPAGSFGRRRRKGPNLGKSLKCYFNTWFW
jgi:hypothetical protein